MHVDVHYPQIVAEMQRKSPLDGMSLDGVSYACRRDNPDEYAEIIAREFRHGLRVGVNKGTVGIS